VFFEILNYIIPVSGSKKKEKATASIKYPDLCTALSNGIRIIHIDHAKDTFLSQAAISGAILPVNLFPGNLTIR
jgi:hypothetical protein